MRGTRKFSRFLAAFAGAVFHVALLGDMGALRLGREAGVRRGTD